MTSTRGIDFATLTLKDALDLAIRIEEEAYERYGELADQMDLHDTPDAAHFFRFMMANEEKHRAELTERLGRLGYEHLEDWAGVENLEERVDGDAEIDPVVLEELRRKS